MNIYQRIILAVGAIVFIVILFTTPRTFQDQYGRLLAYSSLSQEHKKICYPLIPIQNAAVRGSAVLGAIAMLWLAAKGLSTNKKNENK
jgi:hypothetical protein